MRVTISYEALVEMLSRRGKHYISVHELATMLGISRQAAGKILATMARLGLVERWSRRTYKLLPPEKR